MDKTYSVTYLSSFTSGTSGASARACIYAHTCMHMCTHSNDFENKKDLLFFFSFFKVFFSTIIFVQDTGYMGSRQSNTDHVPKSKQKKTNKKRNITRRCMYYSG